MGFFFYGTLCHPSLLSVILGHEATFQPAFLPDHSVFWVKDQPFPMLVAGGGGVAGMLMANLSDEDVARLNYYECGFHYVAREHGVTLADGRRLVAQVCYPEPGRWQAGAIWSLADWRPRWAETVVAAATDFMAQYPHTPPETVQRRYGQMLVRSGARVRAKKLRAGTEALRRVRTVGDVDCQSVTYPYSAYFSVEERDLRFRRYDGAMSPVVNRAAFISGDAAILLPYDPIRDRVMLIEQFRAGPYARGDANPWLLEAIAGRIDGGETPDEAARREAREEAGIDLTDLLEGPRYYPSPAAKAEYLYSFVGLADLPDSAAGLGGLDSEAEDIRSHVISFDRLMALVASGEVDNAPLLILAYWLAAERPRLRAAAGA